MANATVALNLDIKQVENLVEKLVEKLNINQKIRLVRKLEEETWQKRMKQIVANVRQRAKKNPISRKEITRICEDVRQELYEERIKSSR